DVVEVEARRAEVHQPVGIVLLLQAARRVEREVVVDELAEVGVAGVDAAVLLGVLELRGRVLGRRGGAAVVSLLGLGRHRALGAGRLVCWEMTSPPRVYAPRPREVRARAGDGGAPLNPEQRAAAEHGAGPLLIIAGAGTGKTRTLVHRVAHLIDRGVAPERIL